MLTMYNLPYLATPEMVKLDQLYKVLTGQEHYTLMRGDAGPASNIFMRHIEAAMPTNDIPNNEYAICITRTNFHRNDIREAKQTITNMVARYPAMKINIPLSAALTPKMGLTTIWYDETTKIHHAITTQAGVPYHIFLALLMLKLVDNEDFTRRATAAIMSGEELQYSPEEQQLLDNLRRAEELEERTRAFQLLMQPKDYTADISAQQAAIATYESRIAETLEKLQQLEMRQYYEKYMQRDADNAINELQEYLMDEKSIIKVFKSDSSITIVNEAYLHIPETASDFFKPEAIENPGHMLHANPMIKELLEDVMLGKVRVPIRASYQLTFQRARDLSSVRIRGDASSNRVDDVMSWDRAMVNLHVTTYECFGGYKNQMMARIQNRDIIGMLEVMAQCTSNVSVFDTTVMSNIVIRMKRMSHNIPIKYKEDNAWHDTTIGGYYEKIKARQRRAAESNSRDHIESNIVNEVTDNQLHITDTTETTDLWIR